MLTNLGKLAGLLQILVGALSEEIYYIGLYTNTVTWTSATTFADLVEVTAAGYARINTAWAGGPFINGSDQGEQDAPPVTFGNTSGSLYTAQGFFYMGFDGTTFWGGDAFAAPIVVPNLGGLQLTPVLLMDNLP